MVDMVTTHRRTGVPTHHYCFQFQRTMHLISIYKYYIIIII